MKDISVFGHKVSPLAAGAIGVGSLAVIWLAWKQHTAASSGSSSASAIDPLTGLPTSQDDAIDPLTGQAYLAEAQEYGSVSAAEQATAGESAIDYSSAYDDGSGLVGTSTGTSLVPANTVQGTTYASNAAWAQAVEAGLTDIGYSSTDVAAALGRYLSNLSETSAQAGIVQAGIAEYGPPPVGSYQVILAPTTTTTGTTTTTTGTGTKLTAPASISVTPTANGFDAGWGAVAGAKTYILAITGAGGAGTGTSTYNRTVTGTHATGEQRLSPGKYKARVQATGGPWSAYDSFTVK